MHVWWFNKSTYLNATFMNNLGFMYDALEEQSEFSLSVQDRNMTPSKGKSMPLLAGQYVKVNGRATPTKGRRGSDSNVFIAIQRSATDNKSKVKHRNKPAAVSEQSLLNNIKVLQQSNWPHGWGVHYAEKEIQEL